MHKVFYQSLIILTLIEELIDSDSPHLYAETYQNGRESGFTVNGNKYKSMTFANDRHSDRIVVYPDNKAMQGLDEKAYKNKIFFGPDDYEKVAEYVVKYLTN